MKELKIVFIVIIGVLVAPIIVLSLFKPVQMDFGIGTAGYYDNKGVWMAKYEINGPHIDVGAGGNSGYLGGVAKVTALTASGKVRVFDTGGKRFFVGVGVDLGSIGGGVEFNMKKREVQLGVSAIIGSSVSLSWEDIYQEEKR